jgi:DNA polymerase-3 subunit alpha
LVTEKLKLRPTPPAAKGELLAWEKELLGLYISAHPYDELSVKLEPYLLPLKNLQAQPDNSFVKSGGLITSVKVIVTKKGENMAFVGLDDKTGKAEVIVFPSVYNQFGKLLADGWLVLVSAKVSRRDGEEAKLLANSFIFTEAADADNLVEMLRDNLWIPRETTVPKTLSSVAPTLNHSITQSLNNSNTLQITFLGKPDPEVVARLRELLSVSRGSKRVRFIVNTGQTKRVMDTDYYVDSTNELLAEIKALVGERNVV